MTEPQDVPDPIAENVDSVEATPEADPLLDPGKLRAVLGMPLSAIAPAGLPALTPVVPAINQELNRTVEEIAQDTVELIRRMQLLEDRQNQMLTRLEQLEPILRGVLHQGQTTHRELVGDRKALAVRSVFKEIVPVLDALEAMEAGLDEGSPVRMQLRGVNVALRSILEHLGYEPFHPTAGDLFDPARMEFAGYADGPSGRVLSVVRPGYRARDLIIRPAAVRIAAPVASPGSAGESQPTQTEPLENS